jgi:hypothetical protein
MAFPVDALYLFAMRPTRGDIQSKAPQVQPQHLPPLRQRMAKLPSPRAQTTSQDWQSNYPMRIYIFPKQKNQLAD